MCGDTIWCRSRNSLGSTCKEKAYGPGFLYISSSAKGIGRNNIWVIYLYSISWWVSIGLEGKNVFLTQGHIFIYRSSTNKSSIGVSCIKWYSLYVAHTRCSLGIIYMWFLVLAQHSFRSDMNIHSTWRSHSFEQMKSSWYKSISCKLMPKMCNKFLFWLEIDP